MAKPLTYDGEISDDIKAYAVAHGLQIESWELKYWREEQAIRYIGEIPHPSGRGRTGLYPPGTAKQVVALRNLLQKKNDLKYATWHLWLTDYWVGDRWTRGRVLDAAADWDLSIGCVRKEAFNASGAAFSNRALNWLEKRPRFYNGGFRLIRKLVGAKRFDTFLFHMLRMGLGKEIETDPAPQIQPSTAVAEDHKVIVTGLGFERLTRDRMPGVKPISPAEIIAALNKIAKRLHGPLLKNEIEALSDATLLLAAKEIAAFASNNQLIFNALAWFYGRHAFGRGHATRLFGRYSNDDYIRMTMLWAVVQEEFISGARMELEIHQKNLLAQMHARSEEFQRYLSAHPALVSIWTPELIRNSWRTSKTVEESTEKLRRAVAAKLIAVIARRGSRRDS